MGAFFRKNSHRKIVALALMAGIVACGIGPFGTSLAANALGRSGNSITITTRQIDQARGDISRVTPLGSSFVDDRMADALDQLPLDADGADYEEAAAAMADSVLIRKTQLDGGRWAVVGLDAYTGELTAVLYNQSSAARDFIIQVTNPQGDPLCLTPVSGGGEAVSRQESRALTASVQRDADLEVRGGTDPSDASPSAPQTNSSAGTTPVPDISPYREFDREQDRDPVTEYRTSPAPAETAPEVRIAPDTQDSQPDEDELARRRAWEQYDSFSRWGGERDGDILYSRGVAETNQIDPYDAGGPAIQVDVGPGRLETVRIHMGDAYDAGSGSLTIVSHVVWLVGEDSHFIYRISGGGKLFYLAVPAGGQATVEGLSPDVYEVAQVGGWTTGYQPAGSQQVVVSESGAEAVFTNQTQNTDSLRIITDVMG